MSFLRKMQKPAKEKSTSAETQAHQAINETEVVGKQIVVTYLKFLFLRLKPSSLLSKLFYYFKF